MMNKERQPAACWLRLARALLLTSAAALSVPAWAQTDNDQATSAQRQSDKGTPSKASSAASPADPEPSGGSQRSAQQAGNKVPVEGIEPGVNTSATQLSSPDAVPAPVPDRGSTPARGATAASSAPGAVGSESNAATKQAKGAKAGSTAATAGAPKSGAPAGKAHDTLQLDTTQITGNRELPKVLYIVPWKRSDLGDLLGRPVNSLLDEVLTPVDRDVFKRQNRYYDALQPDAAKDSAGTASEPQKH